jgi:hypothetical protein
VIIAVWEELDCDSVGEAELHSIQQTLRTRLGEGAVDSPAAIARVLAEEGATLRHPEVLTFDSRWREAEIEASGLVRHPRQEQRPIIRNAAQLSIRLFEFSGSLFQLLNKVLDAVIIRVNGTFVCICFSRVAGCSLSH